MRFTTENSQEINAKNLTIVRVFYCPILGTNATSLYSLLVDYSGLQNGIQDYFSISDLKKTLNLDEKSFNLAKQKLEAVGLIRTYEKADNYHFIFSLNKPLEPSQLRKNEFLYKMVMKKISEESFERFEYANRTKKYEKSDFKEITTTFQDVFSMNVVNQHTHDDSMNTLKLPNMDINSKEDAIENLSSAQFSEYLTKKRPQRNLVELLGKLSSLSFNHRTMNLIIDYSFEVNGKVVANHVETIARDLINRDKTTFVMVGEELKAALDFKAQEFIDSKRVKDNKRSNKSQIEIEDIFSEIGEL